MSAATVLFSVNAYQRVASFFHLVNIQWTSKTKQVTMKFKKKKKKIRRHSKPKLCSPLKQDFECNEKKG